MPRILRATRGCDALELAAPPLPPNASAAKRWRFRRDLVIYLSHRRMGLSQRLLADVFDLPRSRIGTIIRQFARYDPATEEPGDSDR